MPAIRGMSHVITRCSSIKERVILLKFGDTRVGLMRYFLPKTRPSFGVLGAFTLIYVALLLLQIMVNGRHRGLKFSLDLNVVFGSYCLILAPAACLCQYCYVDHPDRCGHHRILIGCPCPTYRVIDSMVLEFRQLKVRQQCGKTNHLAARICFGFGGLSFLLGLLGQAAFV